MIRRIKAFPELQFPKWLPEGVRRRMESEKDGSMLSLVPGGTLNYGDTVVTETPMGVIGQDETRNP